MPDFLKKSGSGMGGLLMLCAVCAFNVGAGVNIHKYSGHDYGSFQRGNAFTLLGYIRMVLAKGVQRLPGAG